MFVLGRGGFKSSPHLAPFGLKKHMEEVFTVVKFIFSTQRRKESKAFSVVTVVDEHTKTRFKRKIRG